MDIFVTKSQVTLSSPNLITITLLKIAPEVHSNNNQLESLISSKISNCCLKTLLSRGILYTSNYLSVTLIVLYYCPNTTTIITKLPLKSPYNLIRTIEKGNSVESGGSYCDCD